MILPHQFLLFCLIILHYVQLYVSRIGFEAIPVCATSHQEVLSITDSFEIISNNIITAYSNEKIQQKRNCTATTKTISFKLEIDEHIVAGMMKIRGTGVARTQYLQYLQAIHLKNLMILECEKFLLNLSKKIPSLYDVSEASCSSRRIFPTFSASATPSSSSLSLSRVSSDGNLFSTDLQDSSQIHVLENNYDFPTSLSFTLSPDDNNILLHLLYCKKLAIEYYYDSKRIFLETHLCSESESEIEIDIINSNRVIRNDTIDAPASRLQCVEIIAVQTLPDNSHSFHPWKSNKSSKILLDEKINLELNRKRNISEL